MARDTGQQIGARVRMQRAQVEIAGRQIERLRCGQSKRGLPQLHRINPKRQMVHHRIAHDDHIQNICCGNARLSGHVHRQIIERSAHGLCHLPVAARVHHGVADPAHQIFAKTDLGIHQAA